MIFGIAIIISAILFIVGGIRSDERIEVAGFYTFSITIFVLVIYSFLFP